MFLRVTNVEIKENNGFKVKGIEKGVIAHFTR